MCYADDGDEATTRYRQNGSGRPSARARQHPGGPVRIRIARARQAVKRRLRRGRRCSGDFPPGSYFLVQFADDEELEPAALAFFASRFSFSDLLAAVFEFFEPPLSLLAMVSSSRRSDRVLTVSP
jgi:hypothetical protein